MVEKVENQSVDFLGPIIQEESNIMDFNTQSTLLEISKNYNKMINNMFKVCADICIKNFNYPKLSESEIICTENCQRKFFQTYVQGYNYVKLILDEAQKSDIFVINGELDIIKNVKKTNNKLV